MRSRTVRRPHNGQDHLQRHDETSLVDVDHLDMVRCDDGDLADDHVTTGKGKPHDLCRSRVLMEQRLERLGWSGIGLGRLIGRQHGPASLVELYVRGLAGPLDRGVVLAGGDDGAAEVMSSKFDGDPIAPVDQTFGLIGKGETAPTMDLGEPLVFGSFIVPLLTRSLPELGGEVGVWLSCVVHGFSRSRLASVDTR